MAEDYNARYKEGSRLISIMLGGLGIVLTSFYFLPGMPIYIPLMGIVFIFLSFLSGRITRLYIGNPSEVITPEETDYRSWRFCLIGSGIAGILLNIVFASLGYYSPLPSIIWVLVSLYTIIITILAFLFKGRKILYLNFAFPYIGGFAGIYYYFKWKKRDAVFSKKILLVGVIGIVLWICLTILPFYLLMILIR